MGSDKTSLGDRMKNYEVRLRSYVPSKTSAILRIDGKAFHTYTRGLDKPFDVPLAEAMAETTKYLCENIQGAKLGYTQSDEISILLTDYDDINTSAWFDYQVEKMVSVSSSLATVKFLHTRVMQILSNRFISDMPSIEQVYRMKLASFDSRVMSLPNDEEVINYVLWRQQDAERNSIQALAQSVFSHKQLHGKNTANMHDMLHEQGMNWNDCPTRQKRGISVIKRQYPKTSGSPAVTVMRSEWYIDNEMPVISQDKQYVRNVLPPR